MPVPRHGCPGKSIGTARRDRPVKPLSVGTTEPS
uniref:Uncharacterized protein n=1 Tax=Triticum urartu TaxID=4572 RepID=A0A8R7TZR7_TRIUA